MIRKIPLFLFVLLFALAAFGQQSITMTSTSSNAIWQLDRVTNSGLTFEWEASNALIGTQIFTGNAPVFDFSANDGSEINITVTSADNFSGLTQLDLYNTAGGESSFITEIDISNAINLTTFAPNRSTLTSIDVSQNTALQRLFIIGNRQVPDQALNTSNNTQLFSIRIDGSGINSVDLSNNPLLTNVQLNNARLTTSVMDQVLIDLDGHGLSGGSLQIADQTTGESISANALTAYNNLIAKGWTIDVAAPVALIPDLRVSGNGIEVQSSVPAQTDNGTDFGETLLGNPITRTFTVENIGGSDLSINNLASSNPLIYDILNAPAIAAIIPSGGPSSFDAVFNSNCELKGKVLDVFNYTRYD